MRAIRRSRDERAALGITSALRYAAIVTALAGVYFLFGKLGLSLAFVHVSASAVWPPTGIALAATLLLGKRIWPGIFAGAFAVNLLTEGTIATSLGIAAGNTLESIVAAFFIERFAGGRRAFETTQGIFTFAVLGGMVSTIISATIGVTSLSLGGFAAWSNFLNIWLTWWLGDMAGALIIAPFLILAADAERFFPPRRQFAEFGLFFLGVILVTTLVFSGILPSPLQNFPLEFLCFPFLVWAAFRFGLLPSMTATVLLSGIAIWGTLNGHGHFASETEHESLLLLQAFMSVIALTNMVLAAAVAERRLLKEALLRSDKLTDHLEQRTKELRLANEVLQQEILRREHAEAKDVANTERLQRAIEAMPLGALVIDNDRRIMHANTEFCHLLCPDLPPSSLVAQKLEMLRNNAASLLPITYWMLLEDTLTQFTTMLRQEVRLLNGRTMSCDLVPVAIGPTRLGYLLLYQDITDQKQSDAVKSDFMSLASHQLRTPLTAVRWALGRLRRRQQSMNTEQRQLIDAAYTAISTMATVIDVMLRIARLEAKTLRIRPATVSVSAILRRIREQHLALADQKAQQLLIECSPMLSVKTDEHLLCEVLANLCDNAIKYTPPGGCVTLRAEGDGERIQIAVADSGLGIPQEQHDRVFQKFFRGDNIRAMQPNGSGLGLYLASLGVQILGGTITFQSRVNEGTTFIVRIPSRSDDAVLASKQRQPHAPTYATSIGTHVQDAE